MPKRKRSKDRLDGNPPTVSIKSSRYQPSKEELEEEIHIDATPEELAKALSRKVRVKFEDED